MKEKIKIGIIDDEFEKQSSISAKLQRKFTDDVNKFEEVFDHYELIPVIMDLPGTKEEIINSIKNGGIDCLIVDYKLSNKSSINYTGTELASFINDVLVDFPLFILTSHEQDLYTRTTFNTYQVFDFDRYSNDDTENYELNYKIIQQVLNYRKKVEEWDRELKELEVLSGTSADIDDRILTLNKNLAGVYSSDPNYSLARRAAFTSSKMENFLIELSKLVEDIESNR